MPTSRPFVQPGEPLNDFLRSFWQRQIDAAEQETPDYRHPPLPLARIKKVMKSDPEVKVRTWKDWFGVWCSRALFIDDCSRRCVMKQPLRDSHKSHGYTSPDPILQSLREYVLGIPVTVCCTYGWDLLSCSLHRGDNGTCVHHRRFEQTANIVARRHRKGP